MKTYNQFITEASSEEYNAFINLFNKYRTDPDTRSVSQHTSGSKHSMPSKGDFVLVTNSAKFKNELKDLVKQYGNEKDVAGLGNYGCTLSQTKIMVSHGTAASEWSIMRK